MNFIKTTNKRAKKLSISALAILMVMLMLPLSVFAQGTATTPTQSGTDTHTTISFGGEDVAIDADGNFAISSTSSNASNNSTRPTRHFDGFRPLLDDEGRPVTANVVPMPAGFFEAGGISEQERNEIAELHRLISGADVSSLSGAGSSSGVSPFSNPPTGSINVMYGAGEYEWPHNVTMTSGSRTTTVSTKRYIMAIGLIGYELFCADPTLPGPEQEPNYALSGSATEAALRNVLRYGHPTNPFLSDPSVASDTDRMWAAYMTRVGVAIASNSGANFTGDASLIGAAQDLVSGNISAQHRDFDNLMPAIMINGDRHREDLGRTISANPAQSESFTVTYNRRTNEIDNPFYFEWATGTPVGARLIANGNLVATAPANPTQMFRGNVSFKIEMDNTTANQGQEAKVYLVGIHNEWSGRVWRMQHPTNPHAWQDLVFYIPEVLSSAAFSFANNPEPTPTPTPSPSPSPSPTPTPPPTPEPPDTTVTIQKVDAMSRENIPGALMRLQGMSNMVVNIEGAVHGGPSVINFDNTGINLSQVLTAGAPTVSGGDITSEVADGVWTITGLPFGFYQVVEERAPAGFSLLPQHTSYSFWITPPDITIALRAVSAEDGSVVVIPWDEVLNMLESLAGEDAPTAGNPIEDLQVVLDIMQRALNAVQLEVIPVFDVTQTHHPSAVNIIFENFPYSEVVIYKREASNGIGNNQPLAGAHFRIQGFHVSGNSPMVIDRTGVSDENGRLVFSDIPAGAFTISELSPPSGFLLGDDFGHSSTWHVNVGWGQTVERGTAPTHTFFNIPKSSLEVLKVNGITGEPLANAIFELLDPTTGETWQATSGPDGIAVFGRGSYGNFLYPGRTYVIREIQAPPGFSLMEGPREIVLSPGDENRITWHNYHNPSLTVIKKDQDTGERLANAQFTIVAQGSGRPLPVDFPLITDDNGEIYIPWALFAGESERNFIVTEVVPPPGWNLANPNWQIVTLQAGYDNTVVFQNRRMPTLTILKQDSRTGYPIRGAWFTIEYLGATAGTGGGNIGPSGPLTGNPFVTDQNGRIVIENAYSGRFLIREVRAANNYWLDPQVANRTWIIEIRDNEDYLLIVENTLLPTLVITKRNAITWRPVPMTQFRVEFEVPNSPHVMHVGTFMTNSQGQIILPFVQSGWFRVTETRPAPGMTLATNNSFRVFLQPGDNSYTLIREGVIASESMIVPSNDPTHPDNQNNQNPPTTPPTSDEPAVEGDDGITEQLPPTEGGNSNGGNSGGNTGSQNIPNAPTPDIPSDVEVEAIEPDIDAIIDQELAPEEAGSSGNPNDGSGGNSSGNPTYPDIPDFDEDWFDNVDLENMPISHYPNPDLANEANGRLEVWGGEMFWDNDLEIWNFPQNTLVIRKENAVTGELLAGARFSVTRVSSGNDSGLHGTVIGEWTTGHSGILVIAGLDPGFFVVEELIPPNNFTLSSNTRQHVFMRPDDTSVVSVTFSNMPFSGLLITLRCSVTGAPIPNGEFRVTNSAGAVVGTDNGHFWTSLQGEILIPNVTPDSYIITQVTVPSTHVINLVQSTQTIRVNPTGQVYRVDFFADPLSQLLITLRCEVTGQPLQGGEFRVTNSAGNVVGSANGIFFSNMQGEILIPNLGVDSFVVTQLNAPSGFRLNHRDGQQNSQTVFVVRPAETYTLNFTNEPYSGLIIQNLDGYNGDPLPGVRFRIESIDDAGNTLIGEHVTDHNGQIELLGLLGSFVVTQVDVPNGWEHDPQPTRIVHVTSGAPTLVTFVSPRMGSLEITLSDEDGNPLAGGRFEVRHQNGRLVGEFVTPVSGMISIPNLGSGWFTVEQISPAPNHVMTDTGRSVEVATNTVARAHFVNIQRPALVIEKVDTQGNPLAGAEFEVRTLAGALIHRGTTSNGGVITIAQIDPQVVSITEVRAPYGFVITEGSRIVEIVAGETVVERFVNHRAPSLIIEKVDTEGNPLAGAVFEVRTLGGNLIERVTTSSGGVAVIEHLEPNSLLLEEVQAPDGFALVEGSRAIQIVAGQTVTERFVNPRLATLVLHKIDGDTGESLQGVVFEITTLSGERLRNPQNNSFEFVTDNAGMIRIPNKEAGSFVAVELRSLPGFQIADPVTFVVGHDRDYVITIRNYRYPDYTIRKLDGHTGEPLEGVQFEISRYFGDGAVGGRTGERLRNPADGSFIWTSDRAGLIRLPNLGHGTWVATEIRSLPGFRLAEPVIFVVGDNQPTTITINNYRYSVWEILKLDGHTNQPQQGVVFEVARLYGTGHTGDRVRNPNDGSFEFVTGANGRVAIGSLGHGTFQIFETRPLSGFIAAEPQIITVGSITTDTTVTFRNYRMGDVSIHKICGDTGRALEGVVFEIHRQNGERIQNPVTNNFEFVSDSAGRINLGFLAPGSYIAVELRALQGFGLADPVHFEVIQGRDLTVTVRNYRNAELTIRKINSITRAPLEGVIFEISRPDGTRLVNPQTGFHDFISDQNGLIFLPSIDDGRFYLRELQALPGFLIDEEVIAFNVDSSSRQREHLLVVENTPAAGLLIIKTCAQTGMPLAGVEFEVRHADGRLVTGQILDGNQPGTPANSPQMAANGNFVTDSNGRINLNHISPGVFHVTEKASLPGFQLDTTVHVVTVIAGQQTVLEVENSPLAGFRLLKVCAVTGEGIFNVEFMVFDHNGQVVGVFYTDNTGLIDFTAILAPGRYTIRETRPAPGFSRDDVPRTVEFVAGRVTEIVWENVPIAGQLQILKVSGDDNIHNGLPAGTPLAGAVFEIFSARTGNLVDRIVSDHRGMAVSRPLPLGRYFAVEVAAPDFYKINPTEIPFEIEFEGQIVRTMFPNFSANFGVTIRKTGPQEVMQGHSIMYEIPIVRNDSTTPLADFFWRDVLPTEAVRVDRLITGTYSHNLRYRVLATTNRGNEIVVADNLSTLTNNVIELRPVHLGLAANEYIIDFTLFFGQVPAGFTSVERPQVFVDVLPAAHTFLPNGMMFANKVDVGGRVPGTSEWVIGNSTTASTILQRGTLPRSGW